VDEFSTNGTFLKRLIDDSSTTVTEHLQLAWGVAIAPSTFGQFGGDLLVGNNGGDGGINAFNLTTGARGARRDGLTFSSPPLKNCPGFCSGGA
jgi:hypothetical protein